MQHYAVFLQKKTPADLPAEALKIVFLRCCLISSAVNGPSLLPAR